MTPSSTLPSPGWQSHEHGQWLAWGLVADWFILVGRYKALAKYRWFNLHAVAMIAVISFSLVNLENHNKYQRLPNFSHASVVAFHKTVAPLAFILMLAMFAGGVFLRFVLVWPTHPLIRRYFTVTRVRRVHLACGVTLWAILRLMLLSGSFVFCSVYASWIFWLVIGETVVFTAAAAYLEMLQRDDHAIGRVKLSLADTYLHTFDGDSIMRDLKNNALTAHELQDKYRPAKVFLFLNRVYLLNDKFVHPGGDHLVTECNFKDVTRYLVGNTGLEVEAGEAWSHSRLAFDELNLRCIGDISLASNISAFLWNMRGADHGVAFSRECWSMDDSRKLSPDMHLLRLKNDQFYLRLGLEGMAWMGKHFAVTGSTGKIRIYSSCTSLADEMVEFMQAVGRHRANLADDASYAADFPVLKKVINYLPLAVKLYDTEASMSKELVFAPKGKKVLVEGPFGRGFEFRADFTGTITLIVGGTGYVPFVDLLAALYLKTMFSLMNPAVESATFTKYSRRFKDILPFAKVRLIASFRRLDDFLLRDFVVEMHRLVKDYGLDFFDCVVRLDSNEIIGLPKTDQVFDSSFLKDHVAGRSDLVVLCGPPVMVSEVYRSLTVDLGFSKDDVVVH